MKGDWDKAIADYDEVTRLSSHPPAWFNRGNAWANKGDWDKAIADYTKAIQLDPNYKLAYYNRGNGLLRQGAAREGPGRLHRGPPPGRRLCPRPTLAAATPTLP